MGYQFKGDVQSYIDALTPQDFKEAFEEYGFEVELRDETAMDEPHDPEAVFVWKEPAEMPKEINIQGTTYQRVEMGERTC